MSFGNIGNFETLKTMVSIEINIEKVEDMFNIFHRINMSVHVNITVTGVHFAHKGSTFIHGNTSRFGDRTRL